MKIARFKWKGEIVYGTIEGDEIFTVSGNIFEEIKVGNKLCKVEEVRFLTPVEPQTIVGVGSNYEETYDRLRETFTNIQLPKPEERKRPRFFIKTLSSVIGHLDYVVYPTISKEVYTSPEPVAVIKKTAKYVSESEANNYVLGYTCGNDLYALDLQKEDELRTGRAHNCDTFTSFGPIISLGLSWDNLKIVSRVNGKVVKEGNTRHMVFSASRIISDLSQFMTLKPGDIIFLGTIGGTLINVGDILEVDIEGIGILKNEVIAPK